MMNKSIIVPVIFLVTSSPALAQSIGFDRTLERLNETHRAAQQANIDYYTQKQPIITVIIQDDYKYYYEREYNRTKSPREKRVYCRER